MLALALLLASPPDHYGGTAMIEQAIRATLKDPDSAHRYAGSGPAMPALTAMKTKGSERT